MNALSIRNILFALFLSNYFISSLSQHYALCPPNDTFFNSNLVSVKNLTGVSVTLTFIVEGCDNPNYLVSEVSERATLCENITQICGKKVPFQKGLDACYKKYPYTYSYCPISITYSDRQSYVPKEHTGINIWTNGTNVVLLAWQCPLHRTQKLLDNVHRTFATNPKEGIIYPICTSPALNEDMTGKLKNKSFYYLMAIFVIISIVGFLENKGSLMARCRGKRTNVRLVMVLPVNTNQNEGSA